VGGVDFKGKGLTLRSDYSGTVPTAADIAETIIEGGTPGLPVVQTGYSSTRKEIVGLTVRKGSLSGIDFRGTGRIAYVVSEDNLSSGIEAGHSTSYTDAAGTIEVSDSVVRRNGSAGLNEAYGSITVRRTQAYDNAGMGFGFHEGYDYLIDSLSFRNGGGVGFNSMSSMVVNSTLAGNTGAAVKIIRTTHVDSPVIIANSILWGNGSSVNLTATDVSVVVDYNCIQGGLAGITRPYDRLITYGPNNLTVDPKFVSAATGDYRLADNSPAIGAGGPLPVGVTGVRPVLPGGSAFDLGAFENPRAFPTTTALQAPAITAQPVSQTVSASSNATFSVTATGTAPLSYQWRFNGTPIANATNATLALSNVQTNQAGSYSVVITNVAGTITSSVASLTVNQLTPGTVVAWGLNSSGQTTVPAGLSGVVAIAAGAGHIVALKWDGTVVAWGDDFYNQTTVPAGLSGVVAIAAGGNHTVALKSDGTVVAWGAGGLGQSGHPHYGQTTVPAGLSGVVAIAAGWRHTVAVKSDGTVVAWGGNSDGQTTVPTGLSGVVAIAAGGYHTVALKSDGTVRAWGWNAQGQTNVPAGLSGVVAIAAGGDHTVALKSDGTVVAWGRNDYGQTYVPAGLSGVVAIAAGYDHTAALKSDGTVVAWGRSREGQTTVPTGLSGVVAIAAGGYHTVALVGAGSWLTSFYLMISLGGAIGGFLVAVVAHPAGEPDGERRR